MNSQTATYYTVHFESGNYIKGKSYCSPQDVRANFPVGKWLNIGLGPRDTYEKIKAVELESITGADVADEQPANAHGQKKAHPPRLASRG